jgi:N-acetylglucosaminyldiphosphoundecaprenol N-acetyl-beta-D-mannosaminyltransferase
MQLLLLDAILVDGRRLSKSTWADFHPIVAKLSHLYAANIVLCRATTLQQLRLHMARAVSEICAMRVELLGTPVDILSREETLARIEGSISNGTRLQHVALNVAKLVSLQKNPELRDDVEGSDIVGIDGMGIVLALQMLGHSGIKRVSGVDLMCGVLALCGQRGYRPYFLGATPEVVRQAVTAAQKSFPGLTFAGFHDGYFGADREHAVMKGVRESGADCLFIGMPTPRKERLLRTWRDRLDTPFIMGVGGGLDVLAGKVSRAPEWMQERGLEWAFRVYQEPRRMWWRYLSTNAQFAGMLLQLMAVRLLKSRGHPQR